ncbi:MAG: ribbon-helix-helix domain-containing protein [Hyphomonadaceae bacterium]|nr:ribbon-helix-helix domain-containing protein [Hyphomonadaceae bacterium]
MMRLVKKSLNLGGHATSVALEREFWHVLQACAASQHQSLAALIAEIDAGRGQAPLASALRVYALLHGAHIQSIKDLG